MCQKPKALWSCVLFFCKKSRVHLSKKLKPLRKAYATSLQNVVSYDYNDHNDGGGECVDSRSKKRAQSNSKKNGWCVRRLFALSSSALVLVFKGNPRKS
jgi:deoxycytidylate deaminase